MTAYYVLAKWPGPGREATIIGSFELPQDGYLDAVPEAKQKLYDLLKAELAPDTEITISSRGYSLPNGIQFYVESLPVQALEYWVAQACRFKGHKDDSS